MKRKVKFYQLYIILAILISLYFILILNSTKGHFLESTKQVNSKNYIEEITLITEIVDETESLEKDLIEYLDVNVNNVSLIYYELETDQNVMINEDNEFIAGSIYKVGLNFLYYTLAEEGFINLQDELAYKEEFFEWGTGVLQEEINLLNNSYSIQELLDLSIIYSDNIATNMLGNYLGGHSEVRKMIYEILEIDYPYDNNVITANIAFEILKLICENSDRSNFSHLIATLGNTIFNDRINRDITDVSVSHKIGTFNEYVHDVGIFFTERPYILIVLSKNLTYPENTLAEISNLIYEYNKKVQALN